ncbi:hypothetical protein ACFWGI_06485 [Streptomyces niveus]|uniref:hypothetical protein n=1 Tax=Streptomyces niveus TaxID=193462 RepID=UPI00364C62C7
MSEPERFLAVARTALSYLRKAGLDYRLSGSLALHAHGVQGAARTRDIILVTGEDYAARTARSELVDGFRKDGQFRLIAPASAVSGVTTLSVSAADPRQAATLSLQRLPQGASPEYIDGVATAALADCLYRTLDLLRSRNEATDFIDVDAVQHHVGPEVFDRFVSAYLRGRAVADPINEPETTHALLLFDRFTLIMRHSDERLRDYGHPAPERLRTSVLRAAGRMMETVPRAAWMFQMPEALLRHAEGIEITAQFDAAMAAAIPVDPAAARERDDRIRAIQAAIRNRQDATARRKAPTSATGLRGAHPDHRHPTQQDPGLRPGTSPGGY